MDFHEYYTRMYKTQRRRYSVAAIDVRKNCMNPGFVDSQTAEVRTALPPVTRGPAEKCK